MGYYQGDFYAGSMGDPGILSFFGKLAKTAVGFIPGVGPIASQALERIGPRSITMAGRAGVLARGAGRAIMRHPGRAALGGGTLAAAGAAILGRHRIARELGMGIGKRHRRMHVTNVKALRRAIRRATGFAHLARKVLRFTSPRAPKGRAVFRAFRKKKAVC